MYNLAPITWEHNSVPFHGDLRISSVVHKGVAYITSVQRCSVLSKGSGYEIFILSEF